MKNYSLTATYKESSTTRPIRARNKMGALVLSAIEINKQHAADVRFEKGEITVKSPTGQILSTIQAEEE